jgi:hypothetical protein
MADTTLFRIWFDGENGWIERPHVRQFVLNGTTSKGEKTWRVWDISRKALMCVEGRSIRKGRECGKIEREQQVYRGADISCP